MKEAKKKIYLYEENNIIEKHINTEQVLNDVYSFMLDKDYFQIDEKQLERKNFVCTLKAKERLRTILYYISRRIPVLLIGPSGTAKTLSSRYAHEISELKNKEFIQFNMSSNTTQADLLGKFTGDEKSLAGISPKEGPYLRAFKDGHTILLDEINLGTQEVLQCIEESLDTNKLSLYIPGQGLSIIERHKDFMLLATENPNKGLYANKRKSLDNKFMSKFQMVPFESFSEEELYEIAKGLASKFCSNSNIKIEDIILEELVKFHKKMEEYENQKEEITICFTVRQIAASVYAFSENNNIYNTIMILYGAKYKNKEREEIKKILNNFPNLIKDYKEDLTLPKGFLHDSCYENKQLTQAVKSMEFSFNNFRNILLMGDEGDGITQLSLWFSEWYIREKCKEENVHDLIFYSYCTEQTSIYDLIGKQRPTNESGLGKSLIQWQDGFLIKGIEKGGVVILDNIDHCPSTVLERLNSLLDKKYDTLNKQNINKKESISKEKFIVNENPSKNEIDINPNFRLICICNIDKKKNLSPAFVDRLDSIVLENQIKDLNEIEYKKLIKCLLKQKKIKSNDNEKILNQDNENNEFKGFNFNNFNIDSNNTNQSLENNQECVQNDNETNEINENNDFKGFDFSQSLKIIKESNNIQNQNINEITEENDHDNIENKEDESNNNNELILNSSQSQNEENGLPSEEENDIEENQNYISKDHSDLTKISNENNREQEKDNQKKIKNIDNNETIRNE